MKLKLYYYYQISAFLMSVPVYSSVSVCRFRHDIWPDVEPHQRSSLRPQKPTEWTSGTDFSFFSPPISLPPLLFLTSSLIFQYPLLIFSFFVCVFTYIFYPFLNAGGVFSNVVLVERFCVSCKVRCSRCFTLEENPLFNYHLVTCQCVYSCCLRNL